MRKSIFGGVAATGLVLGTSFTHADTAILTVSNGYEGGIAVSQIEYEGGNEICKSFAFTAAMVASRYYGASVTCVDSLSSEITGSYMCSRHNEDLVCVELKPE